MNYKPHLTIALILLLVGVIISSFSDTWQSRRLKSSDTNPSSGDIISGRFDQAKLKSKEEWRRILTEEQYKILQQAGTEIPYTGELNKESRPGTYYSHGCDVALFRSEDKYDSGTGWPSFTKPVSEDALVLRREVGLGDNRIEVLDPCGGHLGHVFDDGPQPTGKRYCMNSVALRFVPDEK